jgi:catechol 2,3-dioxygenase-like lactoylglutathione lyase family enzyme
LAPRAEVVPLGRFLEIAVATQDVAAALAFYESLGFVQAQAGDAWPHAYAVVTDGRIALGLHAADIESPLPTWAAPNLRECLETLRTFGIEAEAVRLDDLSLNQAVIRAPSGQALRLLEARTFSPPALAAGYESELGYFEEVVVGNDDLAVSSGFWESLGFVAFEPMAGPPAKVVASSRDLNLGLVDGDLPAPLLCFSAADMPDRISSLRERGHVFARRVPAGLGAPGTAVLQAPDGVQILLTASG